MSIQFSDHTVEILDQSISRLYPVDWGTSHSATLSAVSEYFCQYNSVLNGASDLIDEALHHALLQDVKRYYHQKLNIPVADTSVTTPQNVKWYYGLLFAGLLLFACEGFDGIVTVLSVLTPHPAIIIIIGIISAVVSVAVNLQYKHVLTISEYLLAEWTTLNELLVLIESEMSHPSHEDLLEYQTLVQLLRANETHIVQERDIILQHHHSFMIQVTKYAVSGLIGLLVFCGGFFLGQAVGVIIAGLLAISPAVMTWPLVVFGALVGLAAIALYLDDRVLDINRLVARWFGYDETALQQLSEINFEPINHFERRIAREENFRNHETSRTIVLDQPKPLGTRFRSRSWSGMTMFGADSIHQEDFASPAIEVTEVGNESVSEASNSYAQLGGW